MLIALSGTPGTGKSSVASILGDGGLRVCHLDDLAAQCGALVEYDETRETWEVDLEALRRSIPRERPLVLVGHLSHLLPVDLAVVLRCHPDMLRHRLEARGWSPSKVKENVEAEAIGVITYEAMERVKTFEVDTTSTSSEGAAGTVLEIIEGKGDVHRAGKLDWSEVILSWF
ncbi:MAG: adenylate kinase family protein [Thermoplasmata archaeon]